MGNWAIRWVDAVKNYDNVVAISEENELDCPNPNQDYSGDRVSLYLDWLKNVIGSRTNLPITSKLYYTTWSNLDVKRAVLAEVDFPTATDYSFDLADHENRLKRWTTFLSARALGENSNSANGWWIGEMNKYELGGGFDTPKFTAEFIEQAFNCGASVACLWTMNRYGERSVGFFDVNGNPTNTLLSIAPDFPRLQSAIA
jgi:hypothetical protein